MQDKARLGSAPRQYKSAGEIRAEARLRSLRRQRGMSLEVLGGLCGVSAAYLSMVENGKRGLDRWSMILALARALKVLPAELAMESTTDPKLRPKRADNNDPGLP